MRLSPPDLRGLQIFRALVEYGGFGGAETALGTGQSTLSFHLKALEERIGFELCTRGRRGFQLTERGNELYEASEVLFSAMSGFEGRLGELKKQIVGTLRVGVVANTVTDPELPLDAVVEACLSKATDAEIELRITDPTTILSELSKGGIEIALTPPLLSNRGIKQKLFYHEMHSLYCSFRHPLFDVPSGEINNELLCAQDFAVRSYADMEEIRIFPKANVRLQSSTMEAQAIFILSGCVIGYIPEHFAEQWVQKGQMRRLNIEQERYASPMLIATKFDRKPSSLQKLFVQELLQRCGGKDEHNQIAS